MSMRLVHPSAGSKATEGAADHPEGVTGPFVVVVSRLDSGERLPVLVDKTTWLPALLASRWVVTKRRDQCAVSTLRADVGALRILYDWACVSLSVRGGLDAVLERGDYLSPQQLFSVARYVRAGPRSRSVCVSARNAQAIRGFLKWALVPSNLGVAGPVPRNVIDLESSIDGILGPLAGMKSSSQRYDPLAAEQVEKVEALIAPLFDDNGRTYKPLRWSDANPFWAETRLRNWLMWCIALDCGLRRGEILKLTLADFITTRDGTTALKVVRRPDDERDMRLDEPAVKTRERYVVLSARIELALRIYRTERWPVGRKSGQPYLIATRNRRPLGIRAMNKVMGVVQRSTALECVTWHGLRHTWAEAVATELYTRNQDEETVTGMLRELGGWSLGSTMPFHYTQMAVAREANRILHERQLRLYSDHQR